MPITANQVKDIRQGFAKLKPATATLGGNRVMTVKEEAPFLPWPRHWSG